MKAFTKFFKLRTGREWDKRFEETPLPPKRDGDGNVLPANEGWYQHENQMGLLASFLRSGPGDTVGGREHGPSFLLESSAGSHDAASKQREVDMERNGPHHREETARSGEEKEHRSECVSMETDERRQEDNMAGYKSMEDGLSTEAAILID